ncbi:MAG: ribonuclease BN [Syntrophobacter sp. DG_60]|nr:MAG: ribonuclease BN [Syntrophobacter sp. DG_60]
MKVNRFINFIKIDIWRIRLSELSRTRSFLINQLRIIILSLRGFNEDKCQLRALALTFYSLLSIVPMLAMAFGIAKGFGFERALKNQLLEKLQGQEEVATRIINFANSLLETTKGGVIAGAGVGVLFLTVIKVLGTIESSFNDIWGIKKPRSLGRKFTDYLSIMLICPVLFIMSSSLTVVIASQIKLIIQKITLLGTISPIIFAILKLLPYCVIWILFSFLYIFMPNTKVNFKSGILAGVIAGTIYQVLQWGYITFQIGVAKYNAIYGSFAALPLFLVWLQLSWLVVLFGAEISFAHQNVDTYEFEPDCLRVSHSFKKLLSLKIVHLLVKNFCKGEKPWAASQISHALEIPIRLVHQILYELVDSGIVSETKGAENKDVAYQPARDIKALTVKNVIDTLEQRGTDNIPVAKSKELDKLSDCLKAFSDVIEKSPANIALKNI